MLKYKTTIKGLIVKIGHKDHNAEFIRDVI